MKKKIIISNYDDISNPYYAGGGAIAIHELSKRLQKTYDITILTGKYPGARNRQIENITYRRIGISFGGAKLGQLVFQFCLPFYALSCQYDVWIENFTPPFSTGFIPLFTKKRVIALVHMLSSKDMERKYKLPFHLIENFGLKFYKEFVVTQENTKKEIKKISPKSKIMVIPNGVSVSKVLSSQKKHILFLGRIEIDQKGIDLLLDAYSKIAKEVNLPLVIAGSGEKKQLEILKELIKKRSLQRYIRLVGRVEGIGKAKLLQESIAVIIPSRFETFSLSALEAFASGVPVIAFDIPGLNWIPVKTAIKVKPFNTHILSHEIEKLLHSSAKQKELAVNGQMFANNFDWEIITNRYKKILAD